MRVSFTAAAERALRFASDWCSRTGREELDAKSLLVGLLSESECRAAVMLAKHGVDIAAVCRQWPTLAPTSPILSEDNRGESPAADAPHGGDPHPIPFSSDIDVSIQAARDRLDFLPRRPELATEHLLLGMVAADHEVAVWLRQAGLDPDAVEAEIRTLYGYSLQQQAAELPESEKEESMYERFTDRARKVMQLANQEAQRFNHECIGTEHILLGLIKEGSGVAAHVLRNLDMDLRKMRVEVEKLVSGGLDTVTTGKLPQTPRAKKAIEYSMEEARNLNHNYVGTEHILLGLLRERECVAAQVLVNLGVNLENVREEVLNLLGHWTNLAKQRTEFFVALRTATIPAAPLADRVSGLHASIVLRVLDAAANRAREGLRVIEDYVRFVLDDQHLTDLCKQMRHDLVNSISHISSDSRLAARETQADVGTELTTLSEQHRGNIAGVVQASFARVQEAYRSLEEFGKLANAEMAGRFKQLRYRAYTLERAVEITRGSSERLAAVRLYVLIDGRGSPEEFERLVVSLIQPGVHAIQLRDKQLPDRELLARARQLRILTWETPVLCVINDRPDIAALAGADGVHVGQDEISVKDARQIVGTKALVGVSTHSIEQARQAVLDGANYIGVGPTFPSDTKAFEQFPGLDLLRAVAAEIRLPAFAIGGITPQSLREVLATGFTRVAVSGAVFAAADPAEAVRELLAILNS
jgi:thiamine-phosphate pyrophosphorylase